MTEQDIIRRVLAGDDNAYADLVRAHQAKILRLCTSLLGDAAQAEDAAQETFVKAYQSLASFRGASAFSTWLYRIATNHCRDLLRKRARQRTVSLEALIERSGDQIQQLFDAPGPPTAALEAGDLADQLLSQLSAEERLIITLREAQGLAYADIAEVLHCSVDAVKARLYRARQALDGIVQHFSRAGRV